MRQIFTIILIGCLLTSASSAGDNSQSQQDAATPPAQTPGAQAPPAKKPPLEVTPQREATALAFVRQHHPELADLLLPLKTSRPQEYEKAIRDLFRSCTRIERFHQRDLVRYQLELSSWKVWSHIQLLAARLTMEDSPQLRNQLRQALDKRVELRIAILRREREKVAGRVDKLDQRIKDLQAGRGQDVERQLRQLTRTSNVDARRSRSQPGEPPVD